LKRFLKELKERMFFVKKFHN